MNTRTGLTASIFKVERESSLRIRQAFLGSAIRARSLATAGRGFGHKAAWAALAILLPIGVHSQEVTATVGLGVGSAPVSMALNPVTNQLYVVNSLASTVTVINGATNATTTIPVGIFQTNPIAVAVNPVTNKIYVVSNYCVTVIDGATTLTTIIPIGPYPTALAVNPVTNQIYVAITGTNNVTVIDGASNSVVATVPTGVSPTALAVNPVTNQIYAANFSSNNVTVIDGATNNTTTVAAGTGPHAIAVNPATNKIYVVNQGDGYDPSTLTVIDGVTNNTTTVATGTEPTSVAVNPVTNKIYVATSVGFGAIAAAVTVIDGATNNTTTVSVGGVSHSIRPNTVAVDPTTNQIYVTCYQNQSDPAFIPSVVAVIDGATNNELREITVGYGPVWVSVNPVTNKIYVANQGSVPYNADNGTVSSVSVIDGASYGLTTVTAGSQPSSLALNPVTNRAYVANQNSANVTVINGSTLAATNVPVGQGPVAVAVNPVTNQIYVTNQPPSGSGAVTVIDGATNNATALPVGMNPNSLAVNPVTNKIYVANQGDGTVTVIDGVTNNTTTVSLGTGSNPVAVAVNPATNQIYLANYGSGSSPGSVTVIDGATNNTTTVTVGVAPISLAVNLATNQIYVANQGDNTVTVIDGATNTLAANVTAGTKPIFVALNPLTNMIYVANFGSGTVTVINGATNGTTTLALSGGYTPVWVAVNPVSNKIYVGTQFIYNTASGLVTMIDGATNSQEEIGQVSVGPVAAVNPITNQIYAANSANGVVEVLTEETVQPIPLTTSISPLTNNQIDNPNPSFTFTTNSAFSPNPTVPEGVYFQVDTWQGPWSAATGTNPSFSGTLASLQPGLHILYAYAADGQHATATQTASLLTGAIQAYQFLVTPSIPTVAITVGTSVAGLSFTVDGTAYTSPQTFSWTIGSSHTVATTSPQAGASGPQYQYVFTEWSDGTANPAKTITVPATATTYTAYFSTLYQLTTLASPAAGGSAMGGGYYAVETMVRVSAMPSMGYAFANWSGPTASNSANTTVTMPNGPLTVTANFTALTPQTITFNNPGTQTVGTNLTLSDSASSGLSVSFSSSTPTVCSVSAATATMLTAGTCSIVATQAGDGVTFAPAVPVTQSFLVNASTLMVNLQTATSLLNFGVVNVCPAGQTTPAPCSQTVTLTYNVTGTGTLGATSVLTGGAPNLDFTLGSGSTCTGSVTAGTTCSVNVTFAPQFPGLRPGAVQLADGSGNTLATTFIYGIGTAPQATFGPGVQSTVLSGLGFTGGVALDGAGNVYITLAEYGTQVTKVSAGGVSSTVGEGLSYPQSVAVDGAGNVYVAEGNALQVVMIPANGGAQTTIGTGLEDPRGVYGRRGG